MAKAGEESEQPKPPSQLTKEPRKDASIFRGSESDRLGLNSSHVKQSTPRSRAALDIDRNYSRAYSGEPSLAQEPTKDAYKVESEGPGPKSSPVKQSRSRSLSPWSRAALHIDKNNSSKDTGRWGKDLDQTDPHTWRAKKNPCVERRNHSSSVYLRQSGGGDGASRSRDTKTLTVRNCRANGRDRSFSPEVKRRKTGWHQDRSLGMGPTRTSKSKANKENRCRSNERNQTDRNARNLSTPKLSPHRGSSRSRGSCLVRTNQTPGGSLVLTNRTPGGCLLHTKQASGESPVCTDRTPRDCPVRTSRTPGQNGNQPGWSFPCMKIPDLTIRNENEGWGPCSPAKNLPKSRYSPPFSRAAPELKQSGTWKESDMAELSYVHADQSGSRSLPVWSQATHCSEKNSDTKVDDWRGKAHDRTDLDIWSPIRSNSLVHSNGGSSRRSLYYYSPLVEGTGAGRDLDITTGRDIDKNSNPLGTAPAVPRAELSGPVRNWCKDNQ